MTETAIADACGVIPRVDLVCYALDRLEAIHYLDRFKGYLRQLGLEKDEVLSLLHGPRPQMIQRVTAIGEEQGWLANPTAHLAAAGVDFMVTVTEAGVDREGTVEPDAEELLEWYGSLPVTVKSWIGVNPYKNNSLSKVQGLTDRASFAGCALSPFLVGEPISAKCFEEVIEWAAAEQIHLWVHSSTHFDIRKPYDLSHPKHLDTVLMRHPELRILIGHGGWPWVDEYCILGIRFEHVAIEFSTFPPRLLPAPGWGLAGLLANRGALAGRIFFGSGSVFQPSLYSQLTKELQELPLGRESESWCGRGLREWLAS